jgi:hypothetical protein
VIGRRISIHVTLGLDRRGGDGGGWEEGLDVPTKTIKPTKINRNQHKNQHKKYKTNKTPRNCYLFYHFFPGRRRRVIHVEQRNPKNTSKPQFPT